MNSRRMRWADYVARIGRRGTLIGYWWGSGWIILGLNLERWVGVMWTGLVWLRIGTSGELL
jgi:hypothetical protein